MQIEHRKVGKKGLILGIASILIALVGGVIFVYITRPQESSDNNQKVGNNLPMVEKKKEPEVVMLELPGASPIMPIDGDYNDNASLWRVVSKDYPLDNASSYVPVLAPASLPSAYGHQLREEPTEAARTMFADAKSAGYNLIVGSGYRSYSTQQTIFNNYASQYGEAKANTFSARPGQSEHQTGLGFDVARADRKCFIDDCFGSMPEAKWIAENSYKYGFIVRYPADKTDITKYQYEPWHLRYVGKDLAKALHESGLTLDEARTYLLEVLAKSKVN